MKIVLTGVTVYFCLNTTFIYILIRLILYYDDSADYCLYIAGFHRKYFQKINLNTLPNLFNNKVIKIF